MRCAGPADTLNAFRYISDGLADCDPSVPESVRDEEEEIAEEQKDDGKLGFCEIQWQQKAAFIDGRKFTKKNFKRLDDPTTTKLSLSITKIDEKDEDRMQIIPLSSPMKVRSPLGYRSSYETHNDLNASPKLAPMQLSVSNIKTISQPLPETSSSHENLRKTSLMSLKSLSMSLRLLKNRARGGSLETVEPTMLETIDETSRKSIFKLDLFERNLKKFVTKSNETDFQSYSEYTQQQQQQHKQQRPKTYFKNQKVYARRSSMSDIHEQNPHPKTLQNSGMSTSSTNVKHEIKKHKDEHKKSVDKTAEMLKEVRKRNMETAKRISAPRRISTAY